MNSNNFYGFDLNASVVFNTLMQERSVTRAANKLFLGQPAVSHALNRLRDRLGDPLFVRTREGMMPTPRALEIHALVSESLMLMARAIEPPKLFDASTSEAVVRFGLPDDMEVCLPVLVKLMAERAPLMRLVIRPADFRTTPALLDTGEIDLALTAKPIALESWHDWKSLKQESFVALYDAKQLGMKAGRSGRLSLVQYLKWPHILVSQNGEFHGAVDEALTKLGHKRHVVIAAARFTTLPLLLCQMPAVANVPLNSVATYVKAYGLQTSRLPFESPTFDLGVCSHARTRSDQLSMWFRALISEIVQSKVVS